MSDGNFNTKLLAPGGFTSGVRTGEARMRQKAIKALDSAIAELDFISVKEAEKLKKTFHRHFLET